MDDEEGQFDGSRYGEDDRPKILDVVRGLIYRVHELHTNVIDLVSVVYPVKVANFRSHFLDELDRSIRNERRLFLPKLGCECCALHDGKWSRVVVKQFLSHGMVLVESIDHGWYESVKFTSFSKTPPFFELFEPLALRISFNDSPNSYYRTRDTHEYFVRFLDRKLDTKHWIVEFMGFPQDISSEPTGQPNDLASTTSVSGEASEAANVGERAREGEEQEVDEYSLPEFYFSNVLNTSRYSFAGGPPTTQVHSDGTEAANHEKVVQEIESGIQKITLSELEVLEVPSVTTDMGTGSADAQPTGQLPSTTTEAVKPTENVKEMKKKKKSQQWKLKWQQSDVTDINSADLVVPKSGDSLLKDQVSKLRQAEKPGGKQVQNTATHIESDGAKCAGGATMLNPSSTEAKKSQTGHPPSEPVIPEAVLDWYSTRWEYTHVGPNHVILNVAFLLEHSVPFNIHGFMHSSSEAEASHFFFAAVLPAAREMLRFFSIYGSIPREKSYVSFFTLPDNIGRCSTRGSVWSQYTLNAGHERPTAAMLLQRLTSAPRNNGVVQNGAAPVDSSLKDRSMNKGSMKTNNGKPYKNLGHLQVSSNPYTSPSFHSPGFWPTARPPSNPNGSSPGFTFLWGPPFIYPPGDNQAHTFRREPTYSIPCKPNQTFNPNMPFPVPLNNQGHTNSGNFGSTHPRPMVQPFPNSCMQPPPNPITGSSFQHRFPPSGQYAPPPNYGPPPIPAPAVPFGHPNQLITPPPGLPDVMWNPYLLVPPSDHGPTTTDPSFQRPYLNSFAGSPRSNNYQAIPNVVPQPNEVPYNQQFTGTGPGQIPPSTPPNL